MVHSNPLNLMIADILHWIGLNAALCGGVLFLWYITTPSDDDDDESED